jgi:hypothetical protein
VAVAYRAVTTVTGGGLVTTAVLNKPTDTAENDIVLVGLYLEGVRTVTLANGFTEIAKVNISTDFQFSVYWRRATSSEPASYTFSWTTALPRFAWCISASGATTSESPVDAYDSDTDPDYGEWPAVSLTTSVADTLLVWSGSNYGGSTATPPTGYTERADLSCVEVATKAWTSSGATGNVSGGGTPYGGQGVIFVALKPGGGAAPSIGGPILSGRTLKSLTMGRILG